MKLYCYIIMIAMITSCKNQDSYLIKSYQAGEYVLGTKLGDQLLDKNEIEIFLDDNENIESIFIKSHKYKTEEGFGVGTNLNDLKTGKFSLEVSQTNLKKGEVTIGDFGAEFGYNSISFIDADKDEVVDYVLLQP